MEIKVREVSGSEEKSTAEIESTLLSKTEEPQKSIKEEAVVSAEGNVEVTTSTTDEQVETPLNDPEPIKLSEEEVLSFIGNRYGEEVTSLDDLINRRKESEPLPEDIAKYMAYKKETGRGFEDFVKLNRDVDSMDEDQLLFEYWKNEKPHLDSDDIDFELSEKFAYDEDDEESSIRKQKIAKKEELAKAKDYFNNLKETYKTKVESTDFIPADQLEDFSAYKKYKEEQDTAQKSQMKKSDYFAKKTDELFNKDFEGFEFKVSDKVFKYKPTETSKLKESQSDLNNFITKHLDEKGYIKDASAYHKSLSLAMNPDAVAKYFYEQGKADAVGDITKESKNVDMSGIRNATQSISSGGFKVTSVSQPSSSGLRIKSNKK